MKECSMRGPTGESAVPAGAPCASADGARRGFRESLDIALFGWMRMKITAMTTTTSTVGMRTKGAKIVSLSGTTWPVAFSTRFSALPCEAWESAMELERPLLQTDQAE